MDWYPRRGEKSGEYPESDEEHQHEETTEQGIMGHDMEQSWNGAQSETNDQEIMDDHKEEENQWYQEWDGETGEEWPEEWPNEEEQQQEIDSNEGW